MAAKDKNGPGNNKAYMPVPKGYKGNWNVPKGTPWKKDSPYNPANKNKGPTSRGVSPESLDSVKKKAAAAANSRVTSRAPGPAAVASAKQRSSATSRVTKKPAGYTPAVAPKVTKKAQGSQNKGTSATAARAADAKRATSPTSRVTKHPKGHKSGSAPYVKPATISPADRKGSMNNIKRAAQTNRANKAASAKASASRTSKSVVRGAANKVKGY